MRQKLITMCDASFEASKRMNNFSAFVRRATLGTDNMVELESINSVQLLAIVLARNQKENGFDDVNNDLILQLIKELKQH
tara:strand:+ start:345 stop:584 length:240 start_codon:yes stop_codon:yes gene_type:complete